MKNLYKLPLCIVFLISTILFAQESNHSIIKSALNPKNQPEFGGRIMFDNAFFSESDLLKDSFDTEQSKSGNQFRRLFLYASGNLQPNVEYKLQVNLINGQVGLRDAFIGFNNIPWIGKVRLGQVKEPIRLSVLNSSNYLTFMERSFLTDFLPIRNSGVLLMNDFFKQKISYQLGLFRNSDKNTGDDKVSEEGMVMTGRLTGMPIQDKDEFLQLGLAASYRQYDENTYSVSSKPEANLSTISYVANHLTDVNNVNIYNSELAYSKESVNFQGEYMWVHVNRFHNVNLFQTFYGQLSWFVTGEHKEIKNSYSGYKRLHPDNNLNKSGMGAWELAVKYSYIDLNDGDVFGGSQKDMTLGVNWYVNPSVRCMFNQVYADVENQGNMHVSQFRVQVDF